MKSIRTIVALAGIAMTVLSGASVASASEVPQYCAQQLFEIESTHPEAAPVCFPTEREVAQYLEHLPGSHEVARAANNVVLGVVYKEQNRTGESLTLWGSNGCVGATFGFPSLASGWGNSISSATGSNGCWLTLYTKTSYAGSSLNCTPTCSTVGSTWNDKVQSLVFRPNGTFGRSAN